MSSEGGARVGVGEGGGGGGRGAVAEAEAALEANRFFQLYAETDPAVTDAAAAAQTRAQVRLAAMTTIDLGLDALSLASIYFLAAIGLAPDLRGESAALSTAFSHVDWFISKFGSSFGSS